MRKIGENMELYKKAERLSNEIIQMCEDKGITLRELQMLKNALPIAIDKKVDEYLRKQKLTQICQRQNIGEEDRQERSAEGQSIVPVQRGKRKLQ